MTAIASGCSICEPAPSAKASGSIPADRSQRSHQDGPQPALRRMQHCLAGRRRLPHDSVSSASSSRMPFFATMPMTMIRPIKLATLKVVPVIKQREDHAGRSTAPKR